MPNIIMADQPSGEDIIQMRGAYTLSNLTGISNLNNIKIYNYSSNSVFSCAKAYSAAGGEISLFFSGETVKVDSGSFNSGNAIGAIKEIGAYDQNVKLFISIAAQTFRNQQHLKDISIPAYTLSSSSADRTFMQCYNLEYINFIHNGVDMPLSMGDCSKLTNDGLIAIANGLKEGSAKTVTLNATPKGRCSSIMGTVSEETVNDVTYHVFTQNDSGTVTLTEFITTTKGWTMA